MGKRNKTQDSKGESDGATLKRGRKISIPYEPKFHPVIARASARLGGTVDQIATECGVGRTRFYEWMAEHPELADAVKEGKQYADGEVESSLFKRAKGFSYKEIVRVIDAKTQGVVEMKVTEKHVAPDTTACIFWLKNRRPGQWRDVQRHELTGKGGEAIQTESTQTFDYDGFKRALAALRDGPESRLPSPNGN